MSMRRASCFGVIALVLALSAAGSAATLGVDGPNFTIDGRLSYEAIEGSNPAIHGMLFGFYAGQAVVDDANPQTAQRWAYPDTGKWDAQRNTDELIASLPTMRDSGVLALAINFQGSEPTSDKSVTGWITSGFNPDGSAKPEYLARLSRVVEAADRLGMVVVLSLLSAAQDEVLVDEAAVVAAVGGMASWLSAKGYRNVLVDVAESCDVGYDHEILKPARVSELIASVKATLGGRLLVAASFSGSQAIPTKAVVAASDCVLICTGRTKLKANIDRALTAMGDTPKPIYHIRDSNTPDQMFTAAENYTSWNYFEQGQNNYRDGWNSLPISWAPETEMKKGLLGSTLFWVWAGER